MCAEPCIENNIDCTVKWGDDSNVGQMLRKNMFILRIPGKWGEHTLSSCQDSSAVLSRPMKPEVMSSIYTSHFHGFVGLLFW